MPEKPATTSLEAYLKGEPLNARLAAIARGEEDPEDAIAEQSPAYRIGAITFGASSWEPDDDDREHLKRLLVEPGWPVLQKLLDREFRRLEDAMKRKSKDNPLLNRDEIASGWANVSSFESTVRFITNEVQAEIGKIKN